MEKVLFVCCLILTPPLETVIDHRQQLRPNTAHALIKKNETNADDCKQAYNVRMLDTSRITMTHQYDSSL